ncbi:MAG: hypothetical protein PHZ25_00125 [Candidatus Pacebacteria bacterium]|nr:hypothetical protein [Candidatus Paceibacterota bacterium]
MERRLKLILREEYLYLAIKAAFLAIIFIQASAWVFIALSLFVFFYSAQNSSVSYFFTFLSFIFSSYFALFFFPEYWYFLGVLVFLGFFTILGLKNLAFIYKKEIYKLLSFLILALIFLVFFWADFFYETHLFLFILLTFGIYFIFFDSFSLLFKEKEKAGVFSLFSTFMILEAVWSIKMLPIGIINQSAIALIFSVAFQEFASLVEEKKINYRRILLIFTSFIFVFLIIMAFSKWTVN